MRIVTGSVLALLVGGVTYMNFVAPERDEPVQDRTVAVATQGAVDPNGQPKPHADTPRADGAASPASTGETAPGSGTQGTDAPGRISVEGVRRESSQAPKLEDYDPTRDVAREGGADGVLTDLLGNGGRGVPGALPQGDGAGASGGALVGAVRDTAGAGLAGVDIEVVSEGGTDVLGHALTDTTGVFQIGGLEPGLYRLRCRPDTLPEGFAEAWFPELCRGATFPAGIGSPCFVVLADGSAPPQELVLVRSGVVAGSVFGSDGAPADDALVRIVAAAPGAESCRAITQTSTEGAFRFELPPGKYRLEAAFRADGRNAGAPPFEPRQFIVTEAGSTTLPPLRASVVTADSGASTRPRVSRAEVDRPEGPLVTIELRGRVLSTFGEPLAGLEVVAQESASGELRGAAQTDENGEWSIAAVTGRALQVVARGERLLAPSEAMPVAVQDGQRRVRVPDLLVTVRRVFRLEGSIVVSEEEIDTFRAELMSRVGREAELSGEEARRAYVRGLRLEQRAVGARNGRTIPIAEDGTFVWSCALPANDVEFVLEARGMRTGGRATRTRLVVTPAGDRTLRVEIPFPSGTATETLMPVSPRPAANPPAAVHAPGL